MVSLLMLLHVCTKVTAFGFSGTNKKDWYFNKRCAHTERVLGDVAL